MTLDRTTDTKTPGIPCAFFDLDDTVVLFASILTSFPLLMHHKYVGPRHVPRVVTKYAKHKLGTQTEADDSAILALVSELIRNQDAEHLGRIGEMAADTLIHHLVFPQAKDWIEQAKMSGMKTALISSAPQQLVRPMMMMLDFDYAVASEAEIGADGRFTGKILKWNDGPEKAVSVRELALLANIDLDESIGYANSIRDQKMLELMGTAVPVNPDRKLRRVAETYGWETRSASLPRDQLYAYLAESRRLLGPAAMRASSYLFLAISAAAGAKVGVNRISHGNENGIGIDLRPKSLVA